jgi:type I restriction enzyme S subunit
MKRYLAYKDSGIEWIGVIPKQWNIKRLKYLDKTIMGQSPESDDCNKDGVGIPFLQGNADFSGLNPNPSVWCEAPSKLAIKDDILLSVRAPVGAVNIANQIYGIGRGLCAIRPKQSRKKYSYYRALCLSDELNRIATGSTYTAISVDEVNNVAIPDPAFDEQELLSNFLDFKTAQIDDLIAKKEWIIELLKEERIAIINQAVTKGLNPKAEMKDSGIKWLGKMPKHWEVKKLKFNAFVQFSNVNKKSEDGEILIRLCNYVDVYYNDFITPDLEFMEATASSEEIKKFHLKVGDVLLTKDSEEWNDIAIPAYMTFEAPDLICGYHLAQVRPQEKLILGKYLFWLLSADCINYQFRIEASGVTRYGLSNYALNNSMCLIPPKKEQEAIATLLDKKTAQLDEQVTRAQKSIELLKEYRTSLISEAVTGKIDVRDEVNA